MLTVHALALLGLAALAIYAVILLALHLLPTGYSPLRDPVSLYADSRWGALYALALVAAGVSALSMAAFGLAGAPLPGVGLVALTALGLARLLLVTVPARLADRDRPPSRRVLTHQLLAAVSFISIAMVVATLTAPFIAWAAWDGPAPLLIAVGILTSAAVVLVFIAPALARTRPYFALIQRAVYVGIILWQAVALIPLAR
jgi:hypothetical protein